MNIANIKNLLVSLNFYFSKLILRHMSLGVAFMLLSCNKEFKIPVKPNIIFILADDMGYNVPECYGGNNILTPHIDNLAKTGMKFTNAYAGNSVCASSRASLMTGLHTGHTSVRGNTGGISLNDNDVTIAEVLKKVGYKTGGFGKWGLGDLNTPGVPENQGFDEFYGYYHQIHAHFFYTDYLIRNGEKIKTLNKQGDSASYTHYKIMKEMKQFIIKSKDTPFFCFGSWTLPHVDDLEFSQIPETDPAYELYKDKPWTNDQKKYAAMNSLADSSLGEIKALVKDLGIEENTIIVFSSDNGGDHKYDKLFDVSGNYKGFKRQFYEGGIKAPLIFYWKDHIVPGSSSDLLNYFADLMPTFANLAEAEDFLPENIDGISIVPTLIEEGIQKKHDYLYWELPAFDWSKGLYIPDGLQQAIRFGDWKMLRHNTKAPWELYNLKTDPYENTNLAQSNQDIVKMLVEKIEQNRTKIPKQIEPEMPEGTWFR